MDFLARSLKNREQLSFLNKHEHKHQIKKWFRHLYGIIMGSFHPLQLLIPTEVKKKSFGAEKCCWNMNISTQVLFTNTDSCLIQHDHCHKLSSNFVWLPKTRLCGCWPPAASHALKTHQLSDSDAQTSEHKGSISAIMSPQATVAQNSFGRLWEELLRFRRKSEYTPRKMGSAGSYDCIVKPADRLRGFQHLFSNERNLCFTCHYLCKSPLFCHIFLYNLAEFLPLPSC